MNDYNNTLYHGYEAYKLEHDLKKYRWYRPTNRDLDLGEFENIECKRVRRRK
ncbi:hypothetical protein [Clostridium sp. Cult3]|uniref:hypothetical protein n=1 Tax=Clostridium sp. Cult3 TaxID=2079004 RepID=UPI001F2B0535|nr:hypothetical protein [Clostridium sp. Cult3]